MTKVQKARKLIELLAPVLYPRVTNFDDYWHYVKPIFWGWKWKDVLEVHDYKDPIIRKFKEYQTLI